MCKLESTLLDERMGPNSSTSRLIWRVQAVAVRGNGGLRTDGARRAPR
jgi:hypothetical protein